MVALRQPDGHHAIFASLINSDRNYPAGKGGILYGYSSVTASCSVKWRFRNV